MGELCGIKLNKCFFSGFDIIVAPTPLRGCNGLICRSDGSLYVCQGALNKISKITFKDNDIFIEDFIDPFKGIFYPDDLTMDEKGNFYAVGHISGEVYKISPDGRKKVIARNLNGPDGICYDKKRHRLFVSECFWGNRLFEIDPEGKRQPRFITDKISIPEAFDVKNGKLIVPDMGTGRIIEVEPDTGSTKVIVEGLISPVALKVGPDDNIYVIEQATGRLLKITDDRQIDIVTVLSPGLDNLAFSPNGILFISSYFDCTIWKLYPAPASQKIEKLFPTGINVPTGIVVKDNKIFVSDVVMIRMIDEKGIIHNTKANPWLNKGYPLPITMTDGFENFLITADFIDDIVVSVNPETGEWKFITKAITPAGMTTDKKSKKLYIAEHVTGQIKEVDLENQESKIVASQLAGPIAVTKADNDLYVAESWAGRVSKIDLTSYEKEVILSGYIVKPKNIVAYENKELFILDAGRREIVKVDLNNFSVNVVASNLPIVHTTYYHYPMKYDGPIGLAVDQNGNVLVGSNENGSIIRLTRTHKS